MVFTTKYFSYFAELATREECAETRLRKQSQSQLDKQMGGREKKTRLREYTLKADAAFGLRNLECEFNFFFSCFPRVRWPLAIGWLPG